MPFQSGLPTIKDGITKERFILSSNSWKMSLLLEPSFTFCSWKHWFAGRSQVIEPTQNAYYVDKSTHL